MKTYDLLSMKGYPMYQTLNCKSTGMDGVYETGESVITIVSLDPISVGDNLRYGNNFMHTVSEIIEEREPNGNHPTEALYQKIKCNYKRALPQEKN